MDGIVKYKGYEIDLAGKKYILPPLGIGAYKHHGAAEKMQNIQDAKDKEGFKFTDIIDQLDDIVELTYLALLRNYPKITKVEIEDDISDIVTALSLVQHLISQNEVVQKQMVEYAKKIQPQATKTAKIAE